MFDAFLCPLCGGIQYDVAIVLHDRIMGTTNQPFALVGCVNCGLLRLHPQPDTEALAAAYPDRYAPHIRPGLSGRAKGVLEQRSVRQLAGYLGAPRRVLDVGCATGDLMLAIRATGNLNVTGVETSAQASKVALSRGFHVFQGELVEAEFGDAAFDTVILSHTLEHVPDPMDFMREVMRVLTPGGVALIWLPNVESIEARIFGRYWIGYDAPRHLTTFGVGTLGRLLATNGFKLDEVTHEAVGIEWAWALRLMAREAFPSLDRVFGKLHPLLILAFTPLAAIGTVTRRSGRIRVIARKR